MITLKEQENNLLIGLQKEYTVQLGRIHHLDLVHPGRVLQEDEVFATLEGTNATLYLEAPFECIVEEVNEMILLLPEKIKTDDLNENWLIKVQRLQDTVP